MISKPITAEYVIDTNTLIGFYTWVPISLNKIFWDKLEVALKEKRWILLDVVVKEILHPKPLADWCKKLKNGGLVTDINDDDRNKAIDINNQYQMIDQDTHKSTVDTYIIAYALNNKKAVFSRETYKTNNDTLYKIPDVCTLFKIEHTKRPEDFLNSIGFTN